MSLIRLVVDSVASPLHYLIEDTNAASVMLVRPKHPSVMPKQGHPGPLLTYIRLGHWTLHIRLQNPPTNCNPNYYENKTYKAPEIKAFQIEEGSIAGETRATERPDQTMINDSLKVRQPPGPIKKAIEEMKRPPGPS